jgi:hypothetical protein
MATPAATSAAALLARYPPAVRALANGARKLIKRALPRAQESVDAAAGMLSYGYGPGYKGMVCTLILSKAGAKIGLVRGSELDDPRGLLEGTGKVHRYIAVTSAADLDKPGVTDLIAATYDAWKTRTAR